VTGDETWCFQYEPETKRQSAEWKAPDEPKPKQPRLEKSKVKTMLICFYDSKGIVHKEFVPPGQNVNAVFYLGVLKRLVRRIRRDQGRDQNRLSLPFFHELSLSNVHHIGTLREKLTMGSFLSYSFALLASFLLCSTVGSATTV